MSLPPAFLDELRGRVGLQSLVGRRVKLSKAGREWKGCCPFHNEKTPSFYVNEDKGFYHCFGCGAHGDAIGFAMADGGLSFMDAVRSLAAEAGLEVPEGRPREADARAMTLRDVADAAAAWFRQQLGGIAGADARGYLDRRGVTAAAADAFGLGFAPDGRSALKSALKAFDPAMPVDAGLLIQPDGEAATYDRFRGRLMFPIRDARGRVVGFGGRALGDAQPKYLNSPDGPLFDKGRLLYNLDRAAGPARKKGRLLLVEGYMDVIGLANVGLTEAAAPLGTALTEAQMALAWRLVDEPMLMFDGDGAGQRAALRAAIRALPLLAPGKSLRFVTLPAGQDPDDLARAGGAAAVEALLATAQALHDRLFDAEAAVAPLDTPERRSALRARLKAHAETISHDDVRRAYQSMWAERQDALFARPRRAFVPRDAARGKGGRGFVAPPPPLRPETLASAVLPAERAEAMLLNALASRPDAAALHAEALVHLPLRSPALAAMRDALLRGEAATPAAGVRALVGDELDEAEFDRRIAAALASLAELHHIDAEMQQLRARYGEEDDAVFPRQAQLAREHARVKARLLAEAGGQS